MVLLHGYQHGVHRVSEETSMSIASCESIVQILLNVLAAFSSRLTVVDVLSRIIELIQILSFSCCETVPQLLAP